MKVKLLILLLSLDNYMLPCLNKSLFGFECPGCGLQRSVAMLIKGDFIGALHMYPAIYTLIPLGVVFIANRFVDYKYQNTLTITLSVLSVTLILTNYIFKLFH